ncbi:SDR family oxidoreductase [Candidatus Poribacteria bacterium]|nr:SDR family oxidoreductase [Candidatus Poribacteria bacterium]MBT5533412.1 SDR family oxidoreductase [Candidatus Poribacteria bacterium]MBT7809192.1 SDR family oxidoreductase [Candidatus Poribacteria bacterium]
MSDQTTGRVAVVTGASSGIGAAVARQLASEGWAVALAARTESRLRAVADAIQDNGHSSLAVPTDVTDAAQVAALFDAVDSAYGRVDALINSAGMSTGGEIADTDVDAWWDTMDVNVRGTYLCSRAALRCMLPAGDGHVINVLSVASETAFAGASAYCASKAAALMFTKVMAAEVRERGVRVTAILPGATDTPLWDDMGFRPAREDMMPTERVAETISFVLSQPRTAVVDQVQVMPPRGIL